jgi:subtilisin family serine protease
LLLVAGLLTVSTIVPASADDHTRSWGLDRIDQTALPLDGRYLPTGNGAGVTVYLVDTGLDIANAQFGGRASGIDLTRAGVADCMDDFGVGHGAFVAGIVAGTRTGVAPGAGLIAVKALGCSEGAPTLSIKQQRRAVVRAAGWIRRNAIRPAVVNMSLSFAASPTVDRAVRRLVRSGIPVVAAAGNQRKNACLSSPARVRTVITVAASTRRDRPWSGSNRGRCVDLWAPGKDITSVLSGGGVFRYRHVGATSWATPFVTGAVALYLQDHPRARPPKVTRWLRRNATVGALDAVPAGTADRLLYVGSRS